MNYLVEGTTPDGFPIDELFSKKAHAVEYCHVCYLNPIMSIIETMDSIYVCEHCGTYRSKNPRCNKCEEEAC